MALRLAKMSSCFQLLPMFVVVVVAAASVAIGAPIGAPIGNNNNPPMMKMIGGDEVTKEQADVNKVIVKLQQAMPERRHKRNSHHSDSIISGELNVEQIGNIVNYSLQAGKCALLVKQATDLLQKIKQFQQEGLETQQIFVQFISGDGGHSAGGGVLDQMIMECEKVQAIANQWEAEKKQQPEKEAAALYNHLMSNIETKIVMELQKEQERMLAMFDLKAMQAEMLIKLMSGTG